MNKNDINLLTEAYGTISRDEVFSNPAVLEFIRNPDKELSDEGYEIAFFLLYEHRRNALWNNEG